jgi:hypothetical protein
MIKTRSGKTPPKTHDELDLAAVKKVYKSNSKDLRGEIVASPFHLYSVEALRDRYELRKPKAVPADVFVFAEGEPADRSVTKVGGLPYWPADKPWPTNADGSPYWFMAQFNFADSGDLFPELPGDLLSILTEDEDAWIWDDQKSVHFLWQTVKPQKLIAKSRFPKFKHTYAHFNCYGVIHRTADYPKAAAKAKKLEVRESYNLAVLNATKIGGVPGVIEGPIDLPGTFLAQLASIQPASKVPYPWVNRKQAYDLSSGKNGIYGNEQMIGDMGSLYLYLQKNGRVRCTTQCY